MLQFPLTAWTAMLKQPQSFVTFTIQDLQNWTDAKLPEPAHSRPPTVD
jgi:hypothetical protein